MSKKVLRDILPPPEKRTIRNIPLSQKSVKSQASSKEEEVVNEDIDESEVESPREKRGSGFKATLWIAVIIIIILFFSLPLIWSSATVNIKTKTTSSSFDKTLTAEQNGEGGAIPFKITSVSKELTSELEATGEEDVERKASGEIIIFNGYSTSDQNLIRNTRFETPEGLIYRIDDTVTVPGATSEDGKLVPGQIKVRVYADFPGEEYNIGLTDFTIPGFKGLPQFDDFYARSATEMTGGLIGRIGVVSDEILEQTKSNLRSELEKTIKEDFLAQIPETSILLPESLDVEFNSLPSSDSNGEKVVVREKATATGIVLDRRALEDEIILGSINESSSGIVVSNLETLNFTSSDLDYVGELESFDFNVSGQARLVWTLDEGSLKDDLSGQPKKNISEILATNYPSVEEAESSIKPFWKRSFPSNKDRIEIIVNAENDLEGSNPESE